MSDVRRYGTAATPMISRLFASIAAAAGTATFVLAAYGGPAWCVRFGVVVSVLAALIAVGAARE